MPAGSAISVLEASEETLPLLVPYESRLCPLETKLEEERQYGSRQVWQEWDKRGNGLELGPWCVGVATPEKRDRGGMGPPEQLQQCGAWEGERKTGMSMRDMLGLSKADTDVGGKASTGLSRVGAQNWYDHVPETVLSTGERLVADH